MHPTVISDKPGDCPICGMRLVPMKEVEQEAQIATPKKKIMYRSTMNPNEVSDKPGKDAMGMDMVAFEVTEGGETSSVPGLTAVSISPGVRQTMGLKLGTVEKRSLSSNLRTSALIVADETRLHRVTVKVEGWIDSLFVDVTGQEVRKGDRLLTIYSPELVTAQEDFLIALKSSDTLAGQSLLDATKRRLQLLDMSEAQIQSLEKTGKTQKHTTLYAPASGIVLDKEVVAGAKTMADQPLMTIADLSVVWGEANIYQSDLQNVRIGTQLDLSLPYSPNQRFAGKITFISPTLNGESRTLQARLEIPNPDGLLKPGMYADAQLSSAETEKLVVPSSAVMFSGNGTYAFKDGGDGHLIPTPIKIGARSDDWYEVLEGLDEGDRVVISANFLVDSESSLKAALEAMTNGSQKSGQGE
jgi:RND family efflux transporter MFP subunit